MLTPKIKEVAYFSLGRGIPGVAVPYGHDGKFLDWREGRFGADLPGISPDGAGFRVGTADRHYLVECVGPMPDGRFILDVRVQPEDAKFSANAAYASHAPAELAGAAYRLVERMLEYVEHEGDGAWALVAACRSAAESPR